MYRTGPTVSIAIFAILGLAIAKSETSPDKQPIQYHGTIREDAQELEKVQLQEDLICRNRDGLVGDEICGYTLYKSHSELPFKVVLQNRKTGKADILLETGYKLDYEKRHKYTFEIAAHDCESGAHSQREKVHIEIEDVNEYEPVWGKDTYMVDLIEGRIYDNILTLEVEDQDGSDDFSQICHFHILTPDAPFTIDQEGVLSNTEPLDYSKKHNFILEVKAEDCGGTSSRLSEKLLINIRVVEVCKPGWKGFHERIEFVPGNTHQPISDEATLEVCDQTCKPKDISTKLKLATEHIGKGCDRDTYSIQSQRKLCGASEEIVDLLPNPQYSDWTKGLPTDDGNEADQIFSFDGKTNAIEVPSAKFNHTMQGAFTISTWMKHEENAEDEDEHGTKEHILCNADGEKMNRHHYSMFIHNCRLVFLLRQEAGNSVDLNVFKPAEWRWKIPEVCDGQWHHYALSVDFPTVRLHIDGKQYVEQKHNPAVIDDWPLHPSRKVHFTKLVVGACWMGGSKHHTQHFRGYLAGLNILNGKTENDRVIQCLNNCKEKLDFHAMNLMETGMSVEFNSEMTEITINGHNVTNIEKLVRKIGYVNSRVFPTPGHRALTIHTDVKCIDGKPLPIPDIEALVMVQQAEEPIITISGPGKIEHPEMDYPHGVKIFNGIEINAETRKEAEEKEEKKSEKISPDAAEQETLNKDDQKEIDEDDKKPFDIFAEARYKLDSCMVKVSPPMNLDVEQISYPSNAVSMVMLEAFVNENGFVMSGSASIENYIEILRHTKYINSAPQDVNHRTFSLVCSELNGRFVSNTFKVQADVIHTNHEDIHIPQAHAHDKLSVPINQYNSISNNKEMHSKNYLEQATAHTNGAGVGMIVIIVVCVGFLAFMIVLGVIRIRAAHQRTQEVNVEEKQEMEWDNSALTITVNPMDQENVFEEEHELNGLRDDDDDSSDDDDGSSFHDDLESSEEEAEKVKDRELEWDDSTLTF